MSNLRTSTWVLGLLLGLSASAAQAQANFSRTNDSSLILLIWDPVAKVSYSRDTGLKGKTLFDGSADAGSQQFWTIDPATDASFAKFSQTSTDLSKDVWMVIGGGAAASGVTSTSGNNSVFTTMVNTTADGVLNPEWPNLTGISNNAFRLGATNWSTNLYSPLEAGNGTAYNNYATAPAGTASSFDVPGSNAYVGGMVPLLADGDTGLLAGDALFGSAPGFDTGNLLGTNGSSSWFYYLTPSSTDPRKPLNNDPITVSAFANSAELAYWGLARTTNSSSQQELVLSFTMPAAVTQTATAAGLTRRNQTDYTAQYGSTLLITDPGNQFAGWTPSTVLTGGAVSAVPEPQSVLMMALGLGGVFAAAARRKRRDGSAPKA